MTDLRLHDVVWVGENAYRIAEVGSHMIRLDRKYAPSLVITFYTEGERQEQRMRDVRNQKTQGMMCPWSPDPLLKHKLKIIKSTRRQGLKMQCEHCLKEFTYRRGAIRHILKTRAKYNPKFRTS